MAIFNIYLKFPEGIRGLDGDVYETEWNWYASLRWSMSIDVSSIKLVETKLAVDGETFHKPRDK